MEKFDFDDSFITFENILHMYIKIDYRKSFVTSPGVNHRNSICYVKIVVDGNWLFLKKLRFFYAFRMKRCNICACFRLRQKRPM
jgi:hypothetical protein